MGTVTMYNCDRCRKIDRERNQKNRNEYYNQGRCRCGRRPVSGMKTCDVCQKIYRRQDRSNQYTKRKENIKAGLCSCGRSSRDGYRDCESCNSSKLKSQRKRRNADEHRKMETIRQSKLRKFRQENDLCTLCGQESDPEYKRCKGCRNKIRIKSRKRREKVKAQAILDSV